MKLRPSRMMHESGTNLLREHDQVRRAKLRLGEVVGGRWRLDELLGVGGMAVVYAATHRNGKRAAVKILHSELSTNALIKRRFIDEGHATNHVGHPGAVSVLDDEVTDSAIFLVMDLLEGETLEQRLQRLGTLEPGEVLTMTDALLDVLAAAHDNAIVHRDVKPSNVFLADDGALKLLDFGIARIEGPDRPHTTKWGETMGTPAFMSPEQARGRWDELDGRTDLWAVGATMFYALSGEQVHAADTTNEELLSAMTLAAPSVGQVVPGLPDALVNLIDRALAFEKADRWPDARTMQAAVRAATASSEQKGPSMPRGVPGHRAKGIDSSPSALLAGQSDATVTSRTVAQLILKTSRRRNLTLAGLVTAGMVWWWVAGSHDSRQTARPSVAPAGGSAGQELTSASPVRGSIGTEVAATPEQATPEQATPEQVIPEQAIPEQAAAPRSAESRSAASSRPSGPRPGSSTNATAPARLGSFRSRFDPLSRRK